MVTGEGNVSYGFEKRGLYQYPKELPICIKGKSGNGDVVYKTIERK